MAKIDISTIEGYADMTPEQKVAALEAFETPDPDYSGYVKKDVFDKTASDLAAMKKREREKLSEDERKQAEAAEEVTNLRNQVQELQKERTIAQYESKLLGQGYSQELASATAAAMFDGDMNTVFANNKKFLEEYAKNVKAEQMKNMPRPPAGGGSSGEYQKQIDEAIANDDKATAAYYIRLQAQNQIT